MCNYIYIQTIVTVIKLCSYYYGCPSKNFNSYGQRNSSLKNCWKQGLLPRVVASFFKEPTSSHSAGLYVSSPSWNLLLSSPQSRPLSLSTPFKRPLFSMALRERYGRTSSTGPNGTYLYTAYPSLPESKMRKILVQWLKAIPVNHWSELWRLGSMPLYILWLFWFFLDFCFKCLLNYAV